MSKKDKIVLLFVIVLMVFCSLACEDGTGVLTGIDAQAQREVSADIEKATNALEREHNEHIAPTVREAVYKAVCNGCND